MGLGFFRRSIEIVKRHRRPGTRISHTIQTNGILVDDEWCAFLRENRFLVGLSMDGPKRLHDVYRKGRGGKPTFEKVMRAAKRLREHRVDMNLLCTVHVANAERPLEVYRFLHDEVGAEFLQLPTHRPPDADPGHARAQRSRSGGGVRAPARAAAG